jgi:sulfur carrier protein ThiS
MTGDWSLFTVHRNMIHVHVTAYGDLRRYLPEGEQDGSIHVALPAGATVAQLLAELKMPAPTDCLVNVNEVAADLGQVLMDSDRVELLLPIGGGSG